MVSYSIICDIMTEGCWEHLKRVASSNLDLRGLGDYGCFRNLCLFLLSRAGKMCLHFDKLHFHLFPVVPEFKLLCTSHGSSLTLLARCVCVCVYVGFHHLDRVNFVSYEINGKWRLLVNKMSVSTALHTQLAAVMESLVHAAVAELKRLMEGRSQLLLGLELRCRSPGQEPPQVDKVQVDSGEAMVRG